MIELEKLMNRVVEDNIGWMGMRCSAIINLILTSELNPIHPFATLDWNSGGAGVALQLICTGLPTAAL